ncbi:MAG: phosphodiesterase [Planctomycetes bacterium]|nr:phosphodiesterase [Planctomycetota bacterium]
MSSHRVSFGIAIATVVTVLVGTGVSPAQPKGSALLAAGPMVGQATETTVTLWARTSRPAEVRFRYWPSAHPDQAAWSDAVTTTRERDFCAHVIIGGLPYGGRFRYAIHLNGSEVALPYETSFRTQVHWRWREPPPDFTVATGSCAYFNDPPSDRPGVPYGDTEYGIFRTIARTRPEFMLWLGDNMYLREPDWSSAHGIRARYARSRATKELQPLLASVHHYAMWDDHDYGPNDSDWTYPFRRASLRAFNLYWANPTAGLDGVPGVFTRFTWNDAEFFLLDDRYHRSPNRAPVGPDKRMWGREQLRWLVDSLVSSEHRFKIIANGNQVLNEIAQKESATRYPHELNELLSEIARRKVTGVVFLSGDRHYSELLRRPSGAWPGRYPLYDFTSSPLLSGLHVLTPHERHNPRRVPDTLFDTDRNFGRLLFRGEGATRSLTFECRGKAGDLKWAHTVRAVDLEK